MVADDAATWVNFVAELRGLAAASGIAVNVNGAVVTLHHPVSSEFIRLQDFGDQMVQVAAGWFVTVSAEYADDPGGQSHATKVVRALIDGMAEECAHLDDAGDLVGLSWIVRHEGGELSGRRGRTDDATRIHCRRVAAWL